MKFFKYLFDNDTVSFYDTILASENVAANKRYKQRMETVVQARNAVILYIELSVLLNFTIYKKCVWMKVKKKITI